MKPHAVTVACNISEGWPCMHGARIVCRINGLPYTLTALRNRQANGRPMPDKALAILEHYLKLEGLAIGDR